MNDHGDSPLPVATDWTTVGGNATKKQAPQATPGQSSKKSNQNGQEIGEIGKTTITTISAPNRNESTFTTRINFKVIPTREIKTISVPQSICRIVNALKAADKNARLIAADENGNEIEFKGTKDLQNNTEANRDYVDKFIDEPKVNRSNQLTGLIVLRSEIGLKIIKKNQVTQKLLNESPSIYLTANYLDVVTPTAVGFFVNTTPRADQPDTFNNRVSEFIAKHDDGTTKYQFEYGHIWGPKNRVSVFKLMSAFEDKDALKAIMENFHAGPNDDTYICMSEYSSLPDEQKIKIIRRQAEYAATHRSLFIAGYKSIHGQLRPGENNEEDDETGHASVGHWIHDRTTSYGKRMFTRVYGVVKGVVELHTTPENIKEAIEWARLAKKEIAGQLNGTSMIEVFEDPEEALDAMESLPSWKPHSLSEKVALMEEPTLVTQPRRRREIVSIGYEKTNQKKKAPPTAKSGRKKSTGNKSTTSTDSNTISNAWAGYGPPSKTNAGSEYNNNYSKQQENDDNYGENMEVDGATTTKPEAKERASTTNRHKSAADTNAKRIGEMEKTIWKLTSLQGATQSSVNDITNALRANIVTEC